MAVAIYNLQENSFGNSIVHKDIMPANIFVRLESGTNLVDLNETELKDLLQKQKYTLVLGDFGLSKDMSQDGVMLSNKGNEPFKSPELINFDIGSNQNFLKSDVFSIAANLLYFV